MKKLLITSCLMCFAVLSYAEPVIIDGVYYNLIEKTKEAEVTYNPDRTKFYSGDIIIPEKIKYKNTEYEVTIIGDFAFDLGANLKTVKLPNSIKKIGISSFNCSGINSIELPSSIEFIDGFAFGNCKNLKAISIPEKVTEIPDDFAFGCVGLTEIVIPENVTRIGMLAFYGCNNLKKITIGPNVKTISISAFGNCPNIEEVTCYCKNVPTTTLDIFEGSLIEYATLYVPSGSEEAYRSDKFWGKFKETLSIPGTNINNVLSTNQETFIYNLDGKRMERVQKGINIIKSSNGDTKKIFIK